MLLLLLVLWNACTWAHFSSGLFSFYCSGRGRKITAADYRKLSATCSGWEEAIVVLCWVLPHAFFAVVYLQCSPQRSLKMVVHIHPLCGVEDDSVDDFMENLMDAWAPLIWTQLSCNSKNYYLYLLLDICKGFGQTREKHIVCRRLDIFDRLLRLILFAEGGIFPLGRVSGRSCCYLLLPILHSKLFVLSVPLSSLSGTRMFQIQAQPQKQWASNQASKSRRSSYTIVFTLFCISNAINFRNNFVLNISSAWTDSFVHWVKLLKRVTKSILRPTLELNLTMLFKMQTE